MIRRAIAALTYGDLLMLLKNQTKPYEATPGESDALVDTWIQKLTSLFEEGKAFSQREVREYFRADRPLLRRSEAPGRGENQSGRGGRDLREILPLANNGLEQFLFEQDCEVMVPASFPL